MAIPLPIGVLLLVFALVYFYRANRKLKQRQQERHERLDEIRQKYLDSIVKKSSR